MGNRLFSGSQSYPVRELPGVMTPLTRFLIDAGFIVAQAYKTFFGAPLITAAGKDQTFTFGCVRDLLRLRQNLGIRAGVVVMGKEAYLIASRDRVLDLIAVLKELKIPYINDARNFTLQLASHLRSKFSYIVTANQRFLQFCAEDLIVVLPRQGKQTESDWMSLEAMKTTMGIVPKDIPTYVALTDPSSASILTSKQAIRLIELYGNIDSIYENLGQVMSVEVRRKLAEHESSIRQSYRENRCELAHSHIPNHNKDHSLDDLDTINNRKALNKYGFHSLLPLLANSVDVRPDSQNRVPTADSYHAVVDRKGLEKLVSAICAAKLCSIDTESDEKDPREATLLGISFSVKNGEAYFVPLVERDLKDLTKSDVLEVLKRIFNSTVEFIGHNIKYDYLMLRKSGVIMRASISIQC